MAHYIQFDSPEGTILVEVDAAEVATPPGVVKAGLGDVVDATVSKAQDTFQSALQVVRKNAQAFIHELRSMDFAPDEVEIAFGIKATAELGNFAIGKVNGDANYSVKLKWKKQVEGQPEEATEETEEETKHTPNSASATSEA
jgi:hypothetical protein